MTLPVQLPSVQEQIDKIEQLAAIAMRRSPTAGRFFYILGQSAEGAIELRILVLLPGEPLPSSAQIFETSHAVALLLLSRRDGVTLTQLRGRGIEPRDRTWVEETPVDVAPALDLTWPTRPDPNQSS